MQIGLDIVDPRWTRRLRVMMADGVAGLLPDGLLGLEFRTGGREIPQG